MTVMVSASTNHNAQQSKSGPGRVLFRVKSSSSSAGPPGTYSESELFRLVTWRPSRPGGGSAGPGSCRLGARPSESGGAMRPSSQRRTGRRTGRRNRWRAPDSGPAY